MPRSLGISSLRLLAAVQGGQAYGLDLITRTGLPAGTVYPTLARLRKARLVKARWEDQRKAEADGRPRRRYYELTPEGEAQLAQGMERVAQASAALKELAGDSGA